MEEIREAEIKEEKSIVKPEFTEEITAKIKTIGEVEDNISHVKDYALELQEYYENIVFTEDKKKEAEDEKANARKLKRKVAEFRKQIVEEYNKPIKAFEDTAKETEKILEDTYAVINSQVKHFDDVELQKINETSTSYFNEYAKSKGIDFVNFGMMNLNIVKGLVTSTGALTKKTQSAIEEFIDQRVKDVELIKPLENADEILVEYKKTLKCADSIALVMDRHKQLEEMQKQKEAEREQKLNDEAMLTKIDECLSAPVVEQNDVSTQQVQNDEILELSFKVRGTREKLKLLKEFLENGGYDYE